MKRPVFLLLFTLTTASGFALAAPVDTGSPVASINTEAEQVMNQYFTALASGDTASLKTLLGGDLLKKRSLLIDNPTYPAFLTKTYMNASFSILGYTNTGPGTVAVDAVIRFSQNESISKQYVLERSDSADAMPYRIVSERSMSE